MESTINRVGDQFFDQLKWSGHFDRSDDLERFAALGLKTLRYPVLWEQSIAEPRAFWQRTDERLNCLRELGIRPIIGLVHHGSGPAFTNLLDPDFGARLAEFAGYVAERYPWLDAYTPVNEPLTTARFSGLYGHWYPHGKSDADFVNCLLHQCQAVVLAMRAIRKINPAAQLIMTEDLGKVFSTPPLKYQADFENERRWLSLDLLTGRVTPQHPLWDYLTAATNPAKVGWFAEHPCSPDIVGLNYYLTSERFLDDGFGAYPASCAGSNARQTYADIEAVRVRQAGLEGAFRLVTQAWERYKLPLALTEIHNGSTREEQLRWLWQNWQVGQRLRQSGVDFRAITVWALLGSFDWNSLVTQANGYYEPGVFDLRAPEPRPTALAKLTAELAAGRQPENPVVGQPGWWERPARFIYGFTMDDDGKRSPVLPDETTIKRMETPNVITTGRQAVILITGATGTLGQAFGRVCELRGLPYHLTSRQELDIADPQAVNHILQKVQPWAVINTAGYVRVDEAEAETERANCYRENTHGAATLAAECARRDLQFLTFSSDLVFDGAKKEPYLENDTPNPLNVYGGSKAEAEQMVLENHPASLVVRTSAFFSPWDKYNFVTQTLAALRRDETVRAADDVFISPTYVPHLVNTCLDLLLDGERGIWHLANEGAVSWAEFGKMAAECAGLNPNKIVGCAGAELGWAARRPNYTALGSQRGRLLPPLVQAVNRYLAEKQVYIC